MAFPTKKEFILVACGTLLFFILTGLFIGIRVDHVALIGLFLALFFASGPTRKLAIALIPFMVFGISYDWMRVFPNYEVNPIDVKGLYETEKALFGIPVNGQILTPNEYFALHNWKVMDFLSGIFYLCWVPVPILFGVWLYIKGERELYLRLALVFLFVNFIGALVFSIIGYFYVLSRGKGKFVKRFIPVANETKEPDRKEEKQNEERKES